MNRRIALAIAAALGLAGAASAQTQPAQTPDSATPAASPEQTTPQPAAQDSTSPSSASSPHQRDTTGKTDTQEAAPASGADPRAAASPHQRAATRTAAADGTSSVTAGMGVQTAAGESIGTVQDVVPNASGQPGYVLIATASGTRTAVPYSTVSSMTRNGKIVLDRARLEAAPQVQDSQLQDRSNTRWQKQADQYWNGSRMRSAAPRDR